MSGEYIGSFKTVWTNYVCLFFIQIHCLLVILQLS
jgi:hypothetical protein